MRLGVIWYLVQLNMHVRCMMLCNFNWPQGITSFGLSRLGRGQAWHSGNYTYRWNILDVFCSVSYRIAETFWGRKLTNFTVLEPPAKVFSMKFGHAIPTYDRFKHSVKVLSAKINGPSYWFAKVFSLENFPLYGTIQPSTSHPLKSLQWNLSKMDTIGSIEVKSMRKFCTLFRRPECPL